MNKLEHQLIIDTTLKTMENIPGCPGSTDLRDDEDVQDSLQDYRVGDVCFYYDYDTENGDDGLVTEKLDVLRDVMNKLGYEEIEINDGSGNGMTYGIMQYRAA